MNDIIYVGRHALTMSVINHFHESWEMIYCTGGSGVLKFEDSVMPYGEDSVAVIPPMTPHRNESEGGFTNIHVNMVDSTLPYKEPLVLQAGKDGHLRHAFSAAYYYYSNSDIFRSTVLPIYGQLLTATVQAMAARDMPSDVVQQIANHILKNYPDVNYDLNAYLQSIPFNPEYLRKMFKSEMGMTPRQYLTDKRLENAARSLNIFGSGANISEIARLSGFSEPLYFSRLFKKKYGVSPKNYTPDNLDPPFKDSDETKFIL